MPTRSGEEDRTPIPQRLYKYRSLLGENRRHVEQFFRQGEAFFPSATAFNDPFDCKVHMCFEGSREEYERWLLDVVARNRPDLAADQVAALVAEDLEINRFHENSKAHAAMLAEMQRQVNGIGIYCLCERPDDIRLWSYYADGHSGLCLQFEHVLGLGVALDVRYSATFPRVNFLRDTPQQQMEANLLTKADQWAHEAEWRIVDDPRGAGLRRLPDHVLSGVIFGCRMSEQERELVKTWIVAGPFNPDLYEAVIKEEEYALEIRQL